jgi:SAM-dependent methyltransferase
MREDFYAEYYAAETRHWWFRARRHIIESLLRWHAPAGSAITIADIGCGPGANWEMLQSFGRVVAVDGAPKALAFCRERGQTSLAAALLPDLPFCNDSIDLVCAFDVIEHVDDDARAVEELFRVCKPGGSVFITVPAYPWLWSDHDEINQHKRRYTRARLAGLLRHPAIEVLKLSYFNSLLAAPLIACRLVGAVLGRFRPPSPPSSDLELPAPIINQCLYRIFAAEAPWLRHWNFPAGISMLAIARKRPAA